MFGYTLDELRQLGREAVADSSDPRLAVALDARGRTGPIRGELTMRRKDGTTFPGALLRHFSRRTGMRVDQHVRSRHLRSQGHDAARERLVRELDAKRRWLEAVLSTRLSAFSCSDATVASRSIEKPSRA
jgi:PAS domain-containing protein